MRIIIEVEGDGTGGPEVVLRSARQAPGTLVSTANVVTAGADIDAGPAPAAPGTAAQSEGQITTPAVPASFGVPNTQSAGAAPSVPIGG
jgi:hypothetical protein